MKPLIKRSFSAGQSFETHRTNNICSFQTIMQSLTAFNAYDKMNCVPLISASPSFGPN